MSLETENVIERRRLRRKLGVWRALAIAALIAALGYIGIYAGSNSPLIAPDQIARVSIEGMITENRKQLQMLEKIGKDRHVKGVLLFVNSPGGTTTGGEALFAALRKLSAKKPVVAQFGTVAASAAYIAGLGTDQIVARGNSITGSVGVIMQWPEVTGLLDKLGVKMHELKSGKLKASPSPFQPLDEETRQVTAEMIHEGQQWFLGLVRDRRKIDPTKIPGLVEGRVFTGRAALSHRLVDQIGGEETAVKWLVEKRKVPAGLKIVDWKPENKTPWSFMGAMSGLLTDVITRTAGRVGRAATEGTGFGQLGLDGLVSVWHPGKN